MPINDILLILQWWFMLLLIGFSFLPLTFKIFSNFIDHGYIFSKILGIGVLSYCVFILGTFHILPFTRPSIILLLIFILAINMIFIKGVRKILRRNFRIIIFEEFIFISALLIWTFIRGTNPDVRGLEKFMDFGFINSILRSEFFPPKDMWLTPFSINYYYFGHLMIALLSRLSDIKSAVTFNLSVATIFAFTFTCSFSIGASLFYHLKDKVKKPQAIIAGLLTAIFVTLAGNLQTIYAFFLPYSSENSIPFWQLIFSPNSFPNSYWYPNATRFIHNTIHEFPIYSFVVSDLHAHVLSIPFVLLTIALLLSIFLKQKLKVISFKLLVLSLSLAILYMTNTWDTVTYFLLTALVIFYIQWKRNSIFSAFSYLLVIAVATFIFILPFSINFKPFTQGIGIICPPQFLINLGNIGPFIFEADHCGRSPIWQLLILYGFFFFWITAFILFIKKAKTKTTDADIFILLLIILSLALIVLSEFIYIKDIYSGHYRANTMFKFTYQAFIMLQISSAYIIFRIFSKLKETKIIHPQTLLIFVLGAFLSFLVLSYPVFAINSYYNNLKNYFGLDGGRYLKTLYSDDYAAINWINKNIKGSLVILEAQGDSYTDFARISANTGLPTVLGWTVHEWLWRGNYSIPAPRITDVKTLYETADINTTRQLLKKYNILYVYVGNMERQKYPNLSEKKFSSLGKVAFTSGTTKIYKINNF